MTFLGFFMTIVLFNCILVLASSSDWFFFLLIGTLLWLLVLLFPVLVVSFYLGWSLAAETTSGDRRDLWCRVTDWLVGIQLVLEWKNCELFNDTNRVSCIELYFITHLNQIHYILFNRLFYLLPRMRLVNDK